ncbi:MAG: EAL domain-containing protein [Acidimicrobiales bacterium]|nr:EAL domain-containing protein [Acidimicrobiales bacterium]
MVPAAAFLFAGLMALLFAWTTSGQLRAVARAHRTAEAAAKVQSVLDRLSAREWAAMAGATVDPEELRHLVDDAGVDAPTSLQPALSELRSLEAAIEAQLTALEQGRRDAAEEIDESTVDPLYDSISEQVGELRSRADRDADAARAAADRIVWALSSLAVAAVGLVLAYSTKVARDRASAEAAELATRRFRSLVEHAPDVVLVVDDDDRVRYHAPAAARMLGCRPELLDGLPLRELVVAEDADALRVALERSRLPGSPPVAQRLRVATASGERRVLDAILTAGHGDASIGGLVLNARDVTESVSLQAELTHLAFHDRLTGLANRSLFNDRLAHALRRPGPSTTTIAVMFVDLDDFKVVNDTMGHAAGDQLLVDAANRIGLCLRAGDTACRLGGDEFAIILDNLANVADAQQLADRLLEALTLPFELAGQLRTVTASIGISTPPNQVTDCDLAIERLLLDADIALYHAKRAGKNQIVVFNPERHDTHERNRLRADLTDALRREDIEVYYQPIVDLDTNAVVGVEALARWTHAERGPIGPAEFIPIAEESGLIIQLGEQVLRRALSDLRAIAFVSPGPPLGVAVNLSALQLRSPDAIDRAIAIIEASGHPPSSLTIELTESVLADDPATLDALERLRSLGCRIAIDDFGTGFSSLSYLERLPIDVLKIDRPFTQRLGQGTARASLAHTIVELARNQHLITVAEGVETAEQADELRQLGCDRAQGYLLARPMPAAALQQFLLNAQAAPPATSTVPGCS